MSYLHDDPTEGEFPSWVTKALTPKKPKKKKVKMVYKCSYCGRELSPYDTEGINNGLCGYCYEYFNQ